jgi:hypothetical protein
MKIEQKNHSKMEDDFKQMTKSFKSDLRKAAEKTVKAQKAKKGKDAQVRVCVDVIFESIADSIAVSSFNTT